MKTATARGVGHGSQRRGRGGRPPDQQVVRSAGVEAAGEGVASRIFLQDRDLQLHGQMALFLCSRPGPRKSSGPARCHGGDPDPENPVGPSSLETTPAARVGHPRAKPTAL